MTADDMSQVRAVFELVLDAHESKDQDRHAELCRRLDKLEEHTVAVAERSGSYDLAAARAKVTELEQEKRGALESTRNARNAIIGAIAGSITLGIIGAIIAHMAWR